MIKTGTIPAARIADALHAELEGVRIKSQEANAELGSHYGHLTELKRALWRLNSVFEQFAAKGYDEDAVGQVYTARYAQGLNWAADIKPYLAKLRTTDLPAIIAEADSLMESGVLTPIIREDGARRYERPMTGQQRQKVKSLLDAVISNFE